MNNGSFVLTQLLFVSVRIDFFAPLEENVSDRQLFNDVEQQDSIRHVKSSSRNNRIISFLSRKQTRDVFFSRRELLKSEKN